MVENIPDEDTEDGGVDVRQLREIRGPWENMRL